MTNPDPRLLSPDADGSQGNSPAERRAGSVQLREPGATEGLPRGGQDTANQSIADALRISFFLLKLGMLALGVLYILSGFQFVKEGEQGIRLLFGKVEDANVEPGFRYSWPFPLGEMVRVETGANKLDIEDSFWVEMAAGDQGKSVDQLGPTTSLKPRDGAGSLLTADGNIAHAKVSTVYRRAVPSDAARNIFPGDSSDKDQEKRIVRLAIQRGVVQAVAEVSIDDLLKQKSGDEGGVASTARRAAQQMLDTLQSGIVIDSLSLEPIAPLFVRADFAKVQAAVSTAAKAIEAAKLDAQRELNTAAGSAAPAIIDAIDAYEAAITRKNEAEQADALARINAILDQGEAQVDSKTVLLTGDASRLMNTARQYHSEILAKRRGQLEAFNAKLAQYEANPDVMIQREWSDSLREFYSKDNVEIFMMYPDIGTLALKLNRDPEIAKKQEVKIKKAELDAATAARNKEWQTNQFKTSIEPTMTK